MTLVRIAVVAAAWWLAVPARSAGPDAMSGRAAAVHELVDLHRRIVADPRFATSPELRALRGRVAARLARLRRGLERDLATAKPAGRRTSPAVAPGGGGQADARQLIDLIQATVRPESWDVAGGTGSIRYFENGHGLVVRATAEVHDEVGDLLGKLR